ncbi:MAG: LON peptidase substrate-binding domain-containing protein [Verrucomicrobiota bacterium]|nr:LON peptidase substrate-binding domain-containing protein [Verrucomicrobiota bacterium]
MDPSIIQEIKIPSEVPVMTLSSTVLFPNAMMPLYIFEPRYKEMVDEVLANNRIFAVAALDDSSHIARELETPRSIASVGIIRACQKNNDGTSNLILQGLARVQFNQIVCDEPYRKARITQVHSKPGGSLDLLDTIKPNLLSLIQAHINSGASIPKEVHSFLSQIDDPENILDMAIYTTCTQFELKQTLLETRDILPRYENFCKFLKSELSRLKIIKELRDNLDDDSIKKN